MTVIQGEPLSFTVVPSDDRRQHKVARWCWSPSRMLLCRQEICMCLGKVLNAAKGLVRASGIENYVAAGVRTRVSAGPTAISKSNAL